MEQNMASDRSHLIPLLKKAYAAEIETLANYLANSIHLDGVRAEKIKEALKVDIQEELNHATLLGNRIKTIGGDVPGSMGLTFTQKMMQPPSDSTDVVAVIQGVIEAEDQACRMYSEIIKAADGVDYVTQDLAITIMGDEEEHRRSFAGFLKEYQK